MKKEYKNAIANVLVNHKMGVNNFEIIDKYSINDQYGTYESLAVFYTPHPDYHYHFINSEESYDIFSCLAVNFTPNLDYHWRVGESGPNFSAALHDFQRWLAQDLQLAINEENEIDLWEEYKNRALVSNIATIDYEDMSNFTTQEKQSVKLALTELKQLIVDRFELNEIQNQGITAKLEYLAGRVEVLDKTDWKGILINTIISISIALSLDAQKGTELMNLVTQVFQFAPGLLNF